MLKKNKNIKRKTNKVKSVKNIIKTKAKKAVIKQTKAKAKKLYKLGYNIIYYLRLAYKV
jgi:hypothetical protein